MHEYKSRVMVPVRNNQPEISDHSSAFCPVNAKDGDNRLIQHCAGRIPSECGFHAELPTLTRHHDYNFANIKHNKSHAPMIAPHTMSPMHDLNIRPAVRSSRVI